MRSLLRGCLFVLLPLLSFCTDAPTVPDPGPPPVATDDGYTASGNIAIAIADGPSDVLGNDQGTGPLTVSEVQGSTANVGVASNTTASGIGSVTGKITLNANGSFTYDPPPGYTGTDQFTYRAKVGDSTSNLTTVTITVSDMMWFVCDACGGDNRGTLTQPFTSVAAFTAANTGAVPAPQPNHKLYIRSGTYDGAADNLTLRDGQLAFGQGVAAATVFTPAANSVAAYAALTAGTAPVIAPTAGNGVNLASGNTLRGFNVGSAGGIGIAGSTFGALTVTGVSVNTTGAGVSLTTGSASATGVAFGSITSGGGTNNIKLLNLSGTNAFALGSGALSGASGNAFDVDNGTAPISYSGTIASTTARPVRIENYDGGTIALSGAVSGSSSGVLLNANTGATISFTGGLSLSTGTNAAFTATGGGTVTATQNNTSIVNTLATTTGTALDVQNTTIGAAGLTFRTISANGGTNGIALSNTGSSGGLTVTGDAGAVNNGSGGTIQNVTGHGISLSTTRDVVLDQMIIQGTAGSGVNGTGVTNFSFTSGTINNSGNALGEASIAFNGNGTLTGNNISGTLTVTGSTLTNAFDSGIHAENNDGTITNAVIQNNVITSSTSTATSKGDGVRLVGAGTASTVASLTKATVSGNIITNFPVGGGVLVIYGNSHAAGPRGEAGIPGDATNIITIANNTISGQSAANRMGTSAITFVINGGNFSQRSRGNLNLFCNGSTVAGCTATGPLANVSATAILIGNNAYADMTAVVDRNVIVANNTLGSNGIAGGNGVVLASGTETPHLTLTVTNNNISQTAGNGILFVGRGTSGQLDLSIKNNTVAAPLGGFSQGIRVDAGNSSSGDDRVCLDIADNVTSGGSASGLVTAGIGLRKQGTTATVNDFGIEGMAATSSPGVEGYVGNGGKNPGTANGVGDGSVAGVLLISAASGFSNCATAP